MFCAAADRMRQPVAVLLFFASAFAAAASPFSVVSPSPAAVSPLSSELRELAAEPRFNERVPILLTFSDQHDVRPLQRLTNVRERRHRMISAFKSKSNDASRNAMVAFLRARGATHIKPLWLSNGIAVTVPTALLADLAQWPNLARIRPDAVVHAPTPHYDAASVAEWNLQAVRAPEVWGLGYTGLGVTVAILDTGVDATHPDLRQQYRGGTNSWFDPYGEHPTPYDAVGHGTAVAGIAVGRNARGSVIGMAPDAQWIAAKIFDDAGLATLSHIHLALQWLLDPDDNPTTNDTPDVVNASWGFDPGTCINEFAQELQLLKAAGVAVVFSAGNSGPGAGTTVSPGNTAGTLSVSAVDSNNEIALFSSRGPSVCDNAIDPELAAPGVGVLSADTTFGSGSGAYAYWSGTSFAAPHVTGALALMLSARPDTLVENLEAIVRETARDLGNTGADNDTGSGALDVFAALARLLSTEAPIATPDAQTTAEDTAVRVDVLDNDTDPRGGVLTLQSVQSVSQQGGRVVLNGDGTLTYTPPLNFPHTNRSDGTDRFTYQVSNGRFSSTGVVNVTVQPDNDAPVAVNDAIDTLAINNSGGVYTWPDPGVLRNDTDADGDALTLSMVTPVTEGSVQLNPGGGFVYTPPAGGAPRGTLSFSYRLSDGSLTSNAATVTFSLNRPPVALNDSFAFSQNCANRYTLPSPGVLANDTDPNADPLAASLVTMVATGQGSVDLNADGGFVYTPPTGGAPPGPVTFTYQTLDDSKLTSNVATATLTVHRELLACDDVEVPVTDTGVYLQYVSAKSVLDNDTGAVGSTVTPVLVSHNGPGTVTLTSNGKFVYQAPPVGAPSGTVSFTYQVSDGAAVSKTANVTFRVPAVSAPGSGSSSSDLPLGTGGASSGASTHSSFGSSPSSFSSSFGSDFGSSFGSVGSSDSRTASSKASDTPKRPEESGSKSSAESVAERGDTRRDKEPEARLYAGDDSFVLDTPNDKGQYAIGSPGVLGNDSGGKQPRVELVRNVRFGRLALLPDGGFTFTPPATGMPEAEVNFVYRLREGVTLSDEATVRLTLRAALVAKDDVFALKARNPKGDYTVDAPGVLANDAGAGSVRAVLVQKPLAGNVKLLEDGSFAYQLPPGPVPKTPLSFTYKVTDGKLNSRTATVRLTLPQSLAAIDDTFVLAARDEWGRYVLPAPGVLANDTGEGSLSPSVVRGVAAGLLILNKDGGLIYAPPLSGEPVTTVNFSYRVANGKRTSTPALVNIRLVPGSAPPSGKRANLASAQPQ